MKDTKTILMVLGIILGIIVTGTLAILNGGHASPALYATCISGTIVFVIGACMKNKSANG